MRWRTESLLRSNPLPKSDVCNKTIVSIFLLLFSGFVLPLLETELMPGATRNLSVLSICSADYI